MDLDKIYKTEYSSGFDKYRAEYLVGGTGISKKFNKLRADRVVISYFKYGAAKITYGEHLNNPMENAKRCIDKYKKTHNTEYLLDAGNYFMFEYMYPNPVKSRRVVSPVPSYENDTSLTEILSTIKYYELTGNKRYLAQGCNACECEFASSSFKDGYYKITSSDESAGISGYCAKDCEVKNDDR